MDIRFLLKCSRACATALGVLLLSCLLQTYILQSKAFANEVKANDSQTTELQATELRATDLPATDSQASDTSNQQTFERGACCFAWRGHVDTQLSVPQFYGSNHTISLRFMPQFPYAYAGPLVSASGAGRLSVGIGDFNWDPDHKTKLYIRVGENLKTFPVEELQPCRWYNLVVVREEMLYKLYLNGKHLLPDFVIPAAVQPTGTLRLGRLTDGYTTDNWHEGQFIGLITDVAVFNRALNGNALGSLISGDSTLFRKAAQDAACMYKLDFRSAQAERYFPGCKRVNISLDGDIHRDALALTRGDLSIDLGLPLATGEPWLVLQGCDDPAGSHCGYAAFCWDLIRAGAPQSNTKGLPMFAATPGKLVFVEEGNGSAPIGKPGGPVNIIVTRQRPDYFATYLHLLRGTFSQTFIPKLSALPQDLAPDQQPLVRNGQRLALIGDVGAGGGAFHLHFGVGNVPDVGAQHNHLITIPVGFRNYDASDDQGHSWYRVLLGMPTRGQWIRRPKSDGSQLPGQMVRTPDYAGVDMGPRVH